MSFLEVVLYIFPIIAGLIPWVLGEKIRLLYKLIISTICILVLATIFIINNLPIKSDALLEKKAEQAALLARESRIKAEEVSNLAYDAAKKGEDAFELAELNKGSPINGYDYVFSVTREGSSIFSTYTLDNDFIEYSIGGQYIYDRNQEKKFRYAQKTWVMYNGIEKGEFRDDRLFLGVYTTREGLSIAGRFDNITEREYYTGTTSDYYYAGEAFLSFGGGYHFQPNGYGYLVDKSSGEYYEGQMNSDYRADGKMGFFKEGHGILYDKHGNIIYKGEWLDDAFIQ